MSVCVCCTGWRYGEGGEADNRLTAASSLERRDKANEKRSVCCARMSPCANDDDGDGDVANAQSVRRRWRRRRRRRNTDNTEQMIVGVRVFVYVCLFGYVFDGWLGFARAFDSFTSFFTRQIIMRV